jgi:hypothetical protein
MTKYGFLDVNICHAKDQRHYLPSELANNRHINTFNPTPCDTEAKIQKYSCIMGKWYDM